MYESNFQNMFSMLHEIIFKFSGLQFIRDRCISCHLSKERGSQFASIHGIYHKHQVLQNRASCLNVREENRQDMQRT